MKIESSRGCIMCGEVPGCFSALRGGFMHTRPKYAAKLTREWAKVLGSEHGGGERAGEWKRWKGRAWTKVEGQVVDVSFSRWARSLASESVLSAIPLRDQYGV